MTYPPDREECLVLFEELKELDATLIGEYSARKYEIIHDLAEAKFYDARSYFVLGLDNPDPDYRWECVSALGTHWQDRDPEFIAKLASLAQHDQDVTVRMIAVSQLGFLQVVEMKPLLERIANSTTEDEFVVKDAQEALANLRHVKSQKG